MLDHVPNTGSNIGTRLILRVGGSRGITRGLFSLFTGSGTRLRGCAGVLCGRTHLMDNLRIRGPARFTSVVTSLV